MSNDTNRLTDYDRNIIFRAVTGAVASWSGPLSATDVLALERIARHSIGWEANLRESELDEIAAIVARLVNSAEGKMTNMAHIRTPRGVPGSGVHGEWMNVVWKVNEIAPGTFDAPTSTGPWWAGGFVEEYPDARILHRHDSESVSIVAKTARGDELLRAAAAALGIHAH